MKVARVRWSLVLALIVGFSSSLVAQNRRGRRPAAPGTVSAVSWSEDGGSVDFTTEGKRYRLDLTTFAKTEIEASGAGDRLEPPNAAARRRFGQQQQQGVGTGKYVGRPSRGRQYTKVVSPDGRWEARYEDWNVVLRDIEAKNDRAVTTEGDEGVHYGTASWVYGEELNQTKSMWFSGDSKKLVYYKFDDREVDPFYLVRGWSEINTSLYPEKYPKAGATNPIAELRIYDIESGKTVPVDLPGSSDEYLYGIRNSPDGKVMMVNWTDRLQRHLRVLAIDLETGKTRPIVEERQDAWQTNSPRMRYLADQHRFLWPSDRTGNTHYELRDLDGKLHNPVTLGDFQTQGITLVDEDSGWVGFTAFSSSANPYYAQYHLVRLDGREHRRVTTTEMHHSNFQLSPDQRWLIAQYESVNTPPCTALYRTDGEKVAQLAEADPSTAANLAEMFQFRSSCGKFDVYGILYKPKDFDPSRSYAVINALYGGPGSREISPSYVSSPRSECERGYLVVKVNNRGSGQRSKAFLTSTYGKLGDVDIQDHADAIRLLRERPYFDGDRVGIVGHSYGGYMAALGILKHPDVYAASVVRAGVTDWRNYDTIYTERYMSTPQLNQEGYDVGSAMTYVEQLKGKMFIMHGMMDDNVHPNNAFQLIEALDKAGKSYESRFWPNGGHGLGRGVNDTQWEFFDRVLQPNQRSL